MTVSPALLVILVSYISGLVAGSGMLFPPAALKYLIPAAIAAGIGMASARRTTAGAIILIISFAATRSGAMAFENSRCVSKLGLPGKIVTMTATVSQGPSARGGWIAAEAETIFDAASKGRKRTRGRVIITGFTEKGEGRIEALPGDMVEFTGEAFGSEELSNPFVKPFKNPLEEGTALRVTVKRANFKIISRCHGPQKLLLAARETAAGLYDKHFPDETAGFLKAFTLGDASGLGDEESADFSDSGLLHVIVASGGHISVLLSFAGGMLAFCPLGRRAKTTLVTATVTAYFSLVGPQAALTRAYTAFILAQIASINGIAVSKMQILLSTLFLHLLLSPGLLFDFGFALSYISTFMLMMSGGTPAAGEDEKKGASIFSGALLAIAASARATAAAMAGTFPLICYKTGYFPLGGFISNIILLWLFEILLMMSLFFLAAGLICKTAAAVIAPGLYLSTVAMLEANSALAGMASLNISPYKMPLYEAFAIAAAGVFAAAARPGPNRPKKYAWILFAAIMFCSYSRSFITFHSEGFEAAFLSVGQGDCQAFRTPRGRWVLVDAGGSSEKIYRKALLPFLRYRRCNKIEAMIITHAHYDHYCAIMPMIRYGPRIEKIVTSDARRPFEPEYERLMMRVKSAGIPVEIISSGEHFRIDGVDFRCLWPDRRSGDGSHRGANADSLVLNVAYKKYSFLMTGDITESEEKAIMKIHSGKLAAQVMKAPHHGSRWSNSEAFIRAVAPGALCISYGSNNRFGHPHAEAVRRFDRSGARVFRTAIDGGTVFNFSDGALKVFGSGGELPDVL